MGLYSLATAVFYGSGLWEPVWVIGAFSLPLIALAPLGWMASIGGVLLSVGAGLPLLSPQGPGLMVVAVLVYLGVAFLARGIVRMLGVPKRTVSQQQRWEKGFYEVIFDNSPNIVHLVDREGSVVKRNKSSRELLGWGKRNALHLSEYVHPEDLAQMRGLLKRAFELGSAQGSVRYLSEGQRSIPVDLFIRRLSTKKAVVEALDRSEVMELRRRLAEEEARYRYLIEAAIDTMESGVVLIDHQEQILWVNRAMEKFFDIPRDELIGRPAARALEKILYRLEEPDVIRQAAHIAYKQGTSVEGITCVVRPGLRRERRIIQYHSYPIETEHYRGGRVEYYVDITRLKELEDELIRKAQSLEELNAKLREYDWAVAHVLKGPVQNIVGLVDWIFRTNPDGSLPQEVRQDLEYIRRRAEHMGKLISDILHFSSIKVDPSSFEPIDLKELLEEVRESMGSLLDGVQFIVDPDLPTVLGIRSRVEEIFSNLIQNAIKFNDKPVPRIEIGCKGLDGGHYIIYVKDNGIGIKEDYYDKIFQIFQKLDPKAEGTGAGLAICRRIVEEHGGRIWVESQVGEGSTFYFTLPKAPAAVRMEEGYVH